MTSITLFSTGPSCMKCKLTAKRFDKHGVEYAVVRLDENPDLLDTVRKAGFGSAPVVHGQIHDGEDVEDVIFEDFHPDLIDQLAKRAS